MTEVIQRFDGFHDGVNWTLAAVRTYYSCERNDARRFMVPALMEWVAEMRTDDSRRVPVAGGEHSLFDYTGQFSGRFLVDTLHQSEPRFDPDCPDRPPEIHYSWECRPLDVLAAVVVVPPGIHPLLLPHLLPTVHESCVSAPSPPGGF